ncbi:beta-galactosidase small subunit [Paenibacillus maysiensis]|uniref:beta-galactosidase small subunit n=1 Tax=Paenibacillus maysiensis TaxID=1155954 RepID=UPI001ADF91BC|nr:beta-galactosidase small subunit [Paenibacillus maysiensis]
MLKREIKPIRLLSTPVSVIIQVHALYHGCIENFNTVVNNANADTIPRIGLSFTFSEDWKNIKWYGRGPWENYADRKSSAFVGIYESSVEEQHVPYVVPVECGGKEDVRYLYVSTKDHSVKITAVGGFHFDIHNHSIEQYDSAAYEDELGASSAVFLHIDYLHAGLGGDNGWTKNIHDEYRIKKGIFTYRMTFEIVE